MQIDHTQEWLRLTQEYRDKADEELRELYQDFADLTDVAQQVLAAELRTRGLDKKSKIRSWAEREASPFTESAERAAQGSIFGSANGKNTTEPVPDEDEGNSESGEPVELSWKTVLCECEEQDQVYQIREVLRRARLRAGFSLAGTGSTTPASWLLQTSSIAPAPSSPTPSHRTSSMSRTRRRPNTSLRVAQGAAQKTPYSSLPSL
jgi:hypothetical protein